MFKKILVANRGEIAVRVVRACRDLGIRTVALYEEPDLGALHMRLADESVRLDSPDGFLDQDAILKIAHQTGTDAIHPGYGFLAENADFILRCAAAGQKFIGPPAEVVELVTHKPAAIEFVRQAGMPAVQTSICFDLGVDWAEVCDAADHLGYPVVVKTCRGGRTLAERLVREPEKLESAVLRAQQEGQNLYQDGRVYLEKAILPVALVAVQILADDSEQIAHLGERQAVFRHNRKFVSEAPASILTAELRQELWQAALKIAKMIGFKNVGSVEFLVDRQGQYFFSEIKARINVDHPLTEWVSGVDLVRMQIRLAMGESLGWAKTGFQPRGWAMLARLNAEEPGAGYFPSPGRVEQVRFPAGPFVRVDTAIQPGYEMLTRYDPLIAKISVWADDRQVAQSRMQRALEEVKITGVANNLWLLQKYFGPDVQGILDKQQGRHLAVAAALLQARRVSQQAPVVPDRLMGGWHRSARQLPGMGG